MMLKYQTLANIRAALLAVLVMCSALLLTTRAADPEPEPSKNPSPAESSPPPAPLVKPAPVEALVPERPETLDTENPAYRPANELVAKSRGLLAILQIDESLLRRALQGIELGEDDLEVVLEMLFRLPQLDIERIETLVQPLPAWDQLGAETPRYLGGVYRLRGIVSKFEDLTPPEYSSTPEKMPDDTLDGSLKRLASRKTIQHVYRTTILVDGKNLQVYSTRVPQAWRKKKAKDQKLAAWEGGQEVEVWAYLLKQGNAEQGPAYYFAAPRVRWYPDTVLGKLGFDYELFDDVQQKRTLLKGENEIFYEFLTTAKRTAAEIYQLAKPEQRDIVELWKNPEQHVGELMTFRGLTRHVSRIAVEDPALAARLGFDYYYYLELFVPLKTPTIVQIQMASKEEDDSASAADDLRSISDTRHGRFAVNLAVSLAKALQFDKIHFDSMPLVFYFHELPAGETILSLKNKQLEVRGFFLKSWRYQSNVPLTNKQHASLFGPLLMGNRPEIIHSEPVTGATIPGLLILGVVAGSLVVGVIYLWLNMRDRNKRPLVLPEKITLDRDEIEV